MRKEMNILISAYFCHPLKGSEDYVGWNFSKNMAAHHNVWVLTKKSNQSAIEEELARNPIKGLNFIYSDFPQNRFFNEQRLGEQVSYIIWQLFSLKTYYRISKTIDFDLVHHLTFNQYRTPSPGFFIDKPFVMGPIGGAELINPVFFADLDKKTQRKEKWRSMGLDRPLFGILARARRNPKTFVFSSGENFDNLNKHLGKSHKSTHIPAISINEGDFASYGRQKELEQTKPFTIIYAGTAKDWKGLSLFLKSLNKAFAEGSNVLVKIIGIRNEDEYVQVNEWIWKYKLASMVELINFMPRKQLLEELSSADLSVYPAFRDSGSMSVLEASALGCPVLCFDTGGQDAFPDHILLKVPVSGQSYDDNVVNVSNKLNWAYNHRADLITLGNAAKSYVFEHLTWVKKVEMFNELYYDVISSKQVTSEDLVLDLASSGFIGEPEIQNI